MIRSQVTFLSLAQYLYNNGVVNSITETTSSMTDISYETDNPALYSSFSIQDLNSTESLVLLKNIKPITTLKTVIS